MDIFLFIILLLPLFNLLIVIIDKTIQSSIQSLRCNIREYHAPKEAGEAYK